MSSVKAPEKKKTTAYRVTHRKHSDLHTPAIDLEVYALISPSASMAICA